MKDSQPTPLYLRFTFGGLAGVFATSIVQPMDVVKNRIQMSGSGTRQKEFSSTAQVFSRIFRNEGVLGLYSGLSAGILRQASYTTVRLGCYSYLFDAVRRRNDGVSPGLASKLAIGMTSGAIGSFFGTPAEISLVRMSTDGRLEPAKRRNYKHVGDALIRIIREEGITTLWRGSLPTVIRAVLVNACQLASYSQFKEMLYNFNKNSFGTETLKCQIIAAAMSGLLTTAVSMPVDMAKTRLQSMNIGEYKGMTDVLIKVIQREGFFSLWKGFTAYFTRLAPHTVITFLVVERLNNLYRKTVLGEFKATSQL